MSISKLVGYVESRVGHVSVRNYPRFQNKRPISPKLNLGLVGFVFNQFWEHIKASAILRFKELLQLGNILTLLRVGLYLPRSVFTHDQLYVALSRVKTRTGPKVCISDEMMFCVRRRELLFIKKYSKKFNVCYCILWADLSVNLCCIAYKLSSYLCGY